MDKDCVSIHLLCDWWTVSVSLEFGCGHLRPKENIVTDAVKEPINFMQMIAIEIKLNQIGKLLEY